MQSTDHIYSVPFKIRSYEVDHNQEATISSICNYFQEAAGLHASKLKFDISDLQKNGLTWILYKLQIKVDTFPKRWNSVRVATWPSTGDGIRAYRDYELYDKNDKRIAVGLSQWMVLDIKKRRPVKIPDQLLNRRYKVSEHVLDLHKGNLPALPSEDSDFILKAGVHDLDMNTHVNNVKYIEWLTGFSPYSQEKKCVELILQYSSETRAGDDIHLTMKPVEKSKDKMVHTLFKNQDKVVIAKAQTHWN